MKTLRNCSTRTPHLPLLLVSTIRYTDGCTTSSGIMFDLDERGNRMRELSYFVGLDTNTLESMVSLITYPMDLRSQQFWTPKDRHSGAVLARLRS